MTTEQDNGGTFENKGTLAVSAQTQSLMSFDAMHLLHDLNLILLICTTSLKLIFFKMYFLKYFLQSPLICRDISKPFVD